MLFMQAPPPPPMDSAPPGSAPAAPRPRPELVPYLDEAAAARITEAEQGLKFHPITYYKCLDGRSMRGVPVDYLGAMKEMEGMPIATGPYRFIGFENTRNGDNVQFIRLGSDEWYADVPINGGPRWDGYYWGARAATKPVADMLRLFFEEMPWLGMLPFTMRRHK